MLEQAVIQPAAEAAAAGSAVQANTAIAATGAKGVGAKSFGAKLLTATKVAVFNPFFGGAVALAAVVGFEFWRGKVDEKKMTRATS
ncbi:MAG: hypothetical protein HQK75_06585 [Candidatus Magnetomorum sp.]|nr:hypothetical protein [Candidatus Magnetomorum sp.]